MDRAAPPHLISPLTKPLPLTPRIMKVNNINTTKISLGILCPIFLAIAQTAAVAEDQPAFTLSKDIQARAAKGEKPVIRVSYHDVSNEFAPFIKKGVEKAATELNVDAQLVGPVG